ncbi:MAG: T9SS type A sorting domain-containing protein [Candidatus Marinimicrobia bacterium]|nr:T9SS type A sorting domain-containing protein [Candidatus Neomarinimicrobiota bacterium]MBT4360159.1 T9SS type A sorting domain-containing protein [Candidatus Neomarinimicrobiota bacterium]MBT4714094.1 T9SS type A sorting domain-containing protein [Candidatus Neomarinimicrobiota bacterium]MBT5270441.1 T9SS type A sorting domain-containing protein [Candidatus Neomarinimicrobiota bacterium]MBT6011810.1 T9SS type A sorting domain-containing protein [Candidatus Neomarinimicrobiota bacterium]
MNRIFACILVSAISLTANTINVPIDQPTIQAGIDASVNGDTVLVQPGTYQENINYNGNNIVVGSLMLTTGDTNYIQQTVIDGGESPHVVEFSSNEDSTAVLLGFTILNGSTQGIFCEYSSPNILSCTISHSVRGIWCWASSPRINDVVVTNNDESGIWIGYESHPFITNSTISNNNGGGIHCTNYSNPTLVDVHIEGNHVSSGSGGGFFADNWCNPQLLRITIIDNQADMGGGGIYVGQNSTVNLDSTLITNNYATNQGGGIRISLHGVLIANRTEISSNSSNYDSGNYFGEPGSIVSLANCTVYGAGIYLQGLQEYSTVANYSNSILWVSSVHVESFTDMNISFSALQGGESGVTGDVSGSSFTSVIDDNPLFTDSSGGDLSLTGISPCIDAGDPSSPFDPDGTVADMGVYYYHVPAYEGPIWHVTINGSDSNDGSSLTPFATIQAGLNAADSTDTVLVQPGTYYENIVWPQINGIKLISAGDPSNTSIDGSGAGSVLYFFGLSATLDTLSVVDGFTIANGANSSGGGIYIDNANPTLRNLTIANNNAQNRGGGMYIYYGGPVHIEGSIIIDNTATQSGGGISIYQGSARITNSEFSKNFSNSGGGISLNGNSLTCTNVLINHNFGSGIFSEYATIGLDSCVIANNISNDNGGGLHLVTCGVSLNYVSLVNNEALYDGGAIKLFGTSLSTDNTTIYNNHSGTGYHGIYQQSDAPNTISNTNFDNHGYSLYSGGNIHPATNNWWGHSSGPYHMIENSGGLGDTANVYIQVTPWLVEPSNVAPPIPTKNLMVTETGNDFITLKWDSSPIGDFSGFRVHYDSDEGGYPYANSIDVGTDTSFSLSGLNLGTQYFLTITVYDTDENDSWYSNEVIGVTRVMEAQNLDISGDEDLDHITNHIPPITYDYFDSMGESQTHYHVQVSTHSDFSVLDMWDSGSINDVVAAFQYLGNPLIDGTTYHLRLRVGSENFWSDWSILTFRMNSIPAIPVLASPIENMIVDEPIQLFINNSSDAEMDLVQYQYFVFDDNSREVFIDSSLWISDTTWQLSVSLSDNNQYWWYARSYDGYEMSELANAASFLVNTENNPPGIFNLTFPEPNGETTSLQPVFTWTVSVDPDPIDTVSYALILDTPEPGIITFDVATNTSMQITESLVDNTEYFWKVIATDMLGFETENAGGYFRFTTNQMNENPSVVNLISPDSVLILTLTPELYWTPAIDPDPTDTVQYEVHWWGDGVEYDSVLTDTNALEVPYELEDNSQYFWEVIAMDQTNGISHSEETTFWIDLFDEWPVGFALLSPENNASGLSPRPSFFWEMAEDPDPFDYATYMLHIATDSSFTDIAFQTPTAATVGYEMVEDLLNDTEYWWRVIATDRDTLSTFSETFKFTVGYVSTAEDLELPTEYVLQQNYPNPFNPITTLRYGLPADSEVSLSIYDITGKMVSSFSSESQKAGWHERTWNGLNQNGELVSTGIYLARLQAGSYSKTIKMLYLK